MNPTIQQLLEVDVDDAKRELDELSVDELLAPARVVSRDDALLVKAAIYLKHGFLEDSHEISQSVTTPTGSYWHGIMHRHEGDISNAHYWYDRVGNHPVLKAIGGYPKTKEDEAKEFDLLLNHTIAAATEK